MYILKRCHVLQNNEWFPIQAQYLTLGYLFNNYREVRLFVSPIEFEEDQYTIDLSDVFGMIDPSLYSTSVTDWLNGELPEGIVDLQPNSFTLDKVGTLHKKDLWDYPVSVTYGNHMYGKNVDVPEGLGIDIEITASDENRGYIDHLANNCLFSVNGRILHSDRLENRLFILDGLRYVRVKNYFPVVSVLDFKALGKISTVRLTTEMMSKLTKTEIDNANLVSRIAVSLPEDLSNKTLLLVIDGYPHFLDGTLSLYDGKKAILTLNDILMCRRSIRDNPSEWHGIDGINIRDTGILVDTYDPIDYISSTTSFILVIDNPSIYKLSRPMGRTDIFGVYTYPYPPKGIAVTSDGDLLEYTLEGYDGNQASLAVADNLRHYPIDAHTNKRPRIVSTTEVNRPKLEVAEARMLDFYTTVDVW